jgi:hypothetical protein
LKRILFKILGYIILAILLVLMSFVYLDSFYIMYVPAFALPYLNYSAIELASRTRIILHTIRFIFLAFCKGTFNEEFLLTNGPWMDNYLECLTRLVNLADRSSNNQSSNNEPSGAGPSDNASSSSSTKYNRAFTRGEHLSEATSSLVTENNRKYPEHTSDDTGDVDTPRGYYANNTFNGSDEKIKYETAVTRYKNEMIEACGFEIESIRTWEVRNRRTGQLLGEMIEMKNTKHYLALLRMDVSSTYIAIHADAKSIKRIPFERFIDLQQYPPKVQQITMNQILMQNPNADPRELEEIRKIQANDRKEIQEGEEKNKNGLFQYFHVVTKNFTKLPTDRRIEEPMRAIIPYNPDNLIGKNKELYDQALEANKLQHTCTKFSNFMTEQEILIKNKYMLKEIKKNLEQQTIDAKQLENHSLNELHKRLNLNRRS